MRSNFSAAFFLLLADLFFTGLIILENDYSISPFMPVAPVMYALGVIILLQRKIIFRSIVALLVIATWFVRLVLVPLIYIMSGYSTVMETSAGTNELDSAALLMSFEFLCVCIFITISKKMDRIAVVDVGIGKDNDEKTKKFINLFTMALLFIAFYCVFKEPVALSTVSTVFDKLFETKEETMNRRIDLLWIKNNSKIIYHLFSNAVYYLQVLIPANLLSHINNSTKAKYERGKSLFFSIIIVLLSVVVTTDNNMDSVCIMLGAFFVVYFLYRDFFEKRLPFIIGAISVFIFAFLFAKTKTDLTGGNIFANLSSTFCAYFSAPPNVSAGFAMRYDDKLTILFGDIVSAVPYMSLIFPGLPTSLPIYNQIVYGYAGRTDQIIPLITTGYHYLGLFAPVLTVGVYAIAFQMEYQFKQARNTFNQVIYAVLMINMTVVPCTLGFTNTIRRLSLFVPLLIFARINSRRHDVSEHSVIKQDASYI